MKEHRLYHTLDRPKYMLYWPLSDCMVCAGFTFLGLLSDALFLSVGLGFLYMMILSKMRRRIGARALRHWLYFYLPHPQKQLPYTPPSYVRELLG